MENKPLIILIVILLGTSAAWSQIDYDTYPKVTTTYLINDVHIQKSPTDSFGLGDILIKDGYITQVGRNISPPHNAYVLEGDSAYVYPAFVDALSHTGIPKSDKKGERPEVKFRGYPPNAVVGITPEFKAHDLVEPSNESIKHMKQNGFAFSHIVPRGKMLPGQGSLMLLEGKSADEMLYSEGVSQYFQLKGSRGFYPSTVIGVMAKWRDLYRKAMYLDKHRSVSMASTGPIKRAKADKSLEALIPATKGNHTIFMKAEKAKDIHRAIALKKDLGYKLVLAEVKQAGPALKKIRAANIPVLISASLPKEKNETKKKAEKKSPNASEKVVDETKKVNSKKAENVVSEEVKALKARQEKSYNEYVGQAALLEQTGVPFGISLLDSKPAELKKSILRMMDAGLTKAGALAALTTHPARILGVSKKLGTIENGKLANVFISDKPYFSKESSIKYLFVEGVMNEFESKNKKKKGSGEGGEDFRKHLQGQWEYEVITPMGNYTGTVDVTGDEELSVVVYSDDDADDEMVGRDISVGDKSLSFTISIDMGDQMVPGTMDLEYDGDEFSGTVTMPGMGSMPISGSKASSPE